MCYKLQCPKVGSLDQRQNPEPCVILSRQSTGHCVPCKPTPNSLHLNAKVKAPANLKLFLAWPLSAAPFQHDSFLYLTSLEPLDPEASSQAQKQFADFPKGDGPCRSAAFRESSQTGCTFQPRLQATSVHIRGCR